MDVTDRAQPRQPVFCRRCGRELDNPTSIAAGIGPICSENLGICQQALADLNLSLDPNLVAATRDDGSLIITIGQGQNQNQTGEWICLRFGYNPDYITQIKQIPGRWWDSTNRQWTLPKTKAGLERAMAIPGARVFVGNLAEVKRILETTNEQVVEMPSRRVLSPKAASLGEDEVVTLSFPFTPDDKDGFYNLVAKVKTLPGRRFLPDRRVWTAPLSEELATFIRENGFEPNETLVSRLAELRPQTVLPITLPSGLNLYPFQKKGVEFIESRRGRAMVADEMGLGKTIQAISWLLIHPELRPAVVVVPASLKINWQREINKWAPGQPVTVLSGRNGNGNGLVGLESHIIIINYDILKDRLESIAQLEPKVLIIDECQLIKNHKAQRTKAVKELGKHCKHVIGLSGTPIVNRPIEFYNAIRLINPLLFPSWFKYASKYCGLKQTQWGMDVTGASNTEELHRKLTATIMIRRLKSDVLEDLPEKTRSVVPLEIDNRQEYNRAQANFLTWVEENFGREKANRAASAEALTSINYLKQLAAQGKMAQVLSWIEDVIDGGEKLIVFAVHHKVVDRLKDYFGDKAVRLTGAENLQQRQAAVDAFQNNPEVKLFIGNIKAAGVGITLTAASHVAFVELGWTPGEHDQAEDRAHRIGQRSNVNIYYLVAERTIEEEIALLLDEKRSVLTAVLDGKAPQAGSILTDLLRRLRQNQEN